MTMKPTTRAANRAAGIAVAKRAGLPQDAPDARPAASTQPIAKTQPERSQWLPRGYVDRKLLDPPVCARAGCSEPPADDSNLCAQHRDDHRARNKRWAGRRRKRNKRRRTCRDCGRFKARGRCPKCKVVAGEAPRGRVDNTVDNAARTWKDPDGRTRYHGQLAQGRRTNLSLDQEAIGDAVRTAKLGEEGLVYAASPEVQALPKAQRDGVKRAALAKLALAQRHLEEVLERHDYEADLAAAAPRPRESGR